MAIDQRRVGELPEMLTRLQFWGMSGQEEQMDVIGNLHLWTTVPACPIQDEDDLFPRSGACRFGERLQFDREDIGADAISQVPERAAGGGMGKGDQIAPIVARLNGRERALSRQRPDALEDRLQADAMFVSGPDLNFRVRIGGGQRAAQPSELFLKAACSSALAATWRGRGRRSRAPNRWR
jgi:hypothetical protein